MSRRLISLNPDLARLADEGYAVSIEEGHLVLRDVPFVDGARRVRRGVLISRLDLAGDRTIAPSDHTAWFGGGTPCDATGPTAATSAVSGSAPCSTRLTPSYRLVPRSSAVHTSGGPSPG